MNLRKLSDVRWYAVGYSLCRLMHLAYEESFRTRELDPDTSIWYSKLHSHIEELLRQHRRKMRQHLRYQVDSCYTTDTSMGLMAAFAKIRTAIDEGIIQPIPELKLRKGENWHTTTGTEVHLKRMIELTEAWGMYPVDNLPTYIYPHLRQNLTLKDVADLTAVIDAEQPYSTDNGGRIYRFGGRSPRLYAGLHDLTPDSTFKAVELSSGVLPILGQPNRRLHGMELCAIPKGLVAVEWFGRSDWYRGNVRYYVTDFIPCKVEFVSARIKRY